MTAGSATILVLKFGEPIFRPMLGTVFRCRAIGKLQISFQSYRELEQ